MSARSLRITQLSARGARTFRGPGGMLDQALASSSAGGRALSWELVAGALADPAGDRDIAKRLPVAELARLYVLGECSPADWARLLNWIGGTEQEARAAVISALHISVCTTCSGQGTLQGGLRQCTRCEGAGVRLLSERQTADLLGVTRHTYRAKLKRLHGERVGRVVDLLGELDARLAGA